MNDALTRRAWAPNISPAVARSRLYGEHGIMLARGLFDADTLDVLLGEAQALRSNAVRGSVATSNGTEGRGGSPARDFVSASGGALHWGLHGSGGILAALSRLCGIAIAATGSGTYSYYERGDFLAIHRDVCSCDVAVITCLADATAGKGGGLLVYPAFVDEPISAACAAGRALGVPVVLEPGDTAILLGGLVPHEVTPVEAERVVAIMCYRAEPPGT